MPSKRAFQDITNGSCKMFKLTIHRRDHRIKLVRWLFEVCMDFKYSNTTFAAAVVILDEYLSQACAGVDEYQLIGITALFVAAKAEEGALWRAQDYAMITDGSCDKKDILRKEVEMLEVLSFSHCISLPHKYLRAAELQKYERENRKSDFLLGFECGVAACLEDNTGYKTPHAIYMAAKKIAEEFLSGEDPGRSVRFYTDQMRRVVEKKSTLEENVQACKRVNSN